MKKCVNHYKQNNHDEPYSSAGRFYTSSAGTRMGLIALIIISTVLLISNNSNNTHATASTLSLSIDSSTVSVDIASVSTQGNFRKSNASTISASTNNATGYTLSIAGSGANYDKLINDDDTNAKLSSVTEATTESQFSALSGTAYNNMWGYLPSKYCTNATDTTTCTTNTDFLPAPTSSGDILDVTSTPNTNNIPNEYQLAIGARVDSTTKIGAYTNTFNVILVGNAIPYTMTFIDSTVSDMPIDINTTSMTEQVTLPSNTPTRNGYTFLGWCTVQPTINPDGNDTCSGTTYQPSSTAYLDQQSTSNDFTFYAMWGGNYTIEGVTYLQDFTYMDTKKKGKIALSMDPTKSYTLKDSRDNQDYTIAVLADGNIWMTENLNLAGGTALDSDKTDVTSAYINSFTTSNNLTKNGNAIVLPGSSTSGFDTNNYSYVYNSGNKTNCGAEGQNTPCYSYYSWDAATLGSGRSVVIENNDAAQSICPKGWKLPSTYNGSGTAARATDFRKLMIGYGGSDSIQDYTSSTTPTGATMYGSIGPNTTPNFLLAGSYNNGSFSNGGSRGQYWSSTSTSDTRYSRYLNFRSNVVSAAEYYYRRGGFGVRCLLR